MLIAMDYSVHRYMIHPTSDELQQWWQLKIIVKLDLCGKFRPPGLKLRVNPFGSSTIRVLERCGVLTLPDLGCMV